MSTCSATTATPIVIPDPPPLTPEQCRDLEKDLLWLNVLSNVMYLFPLAVAYKRKQYIAVVLFLGLILSSTIYHNSKEGGWVGGAGDSSNGGANSFSTLEKIDWGFAVASSIYVTWYGLTQNRQWDLYKIGGIFLGILYLITFVIGAKNKPRRYLTTHAITHVLSAFAAFLVFLAPVTPLGP